MNEPSRGQPPDLEAEPDELEITDLRTADQTGSGEPRPTSSQLVVPRLPVHRLARLVGALAALALVITLLLYGIRSGALIGRDNAQATIEPPLPTPVVRYPDLHGMQCLHDDAWSPDSQYFAYAGNASQSCGYGQYAPNLINIYRARDGAFVRQLAPDPAIFAALGQQPPAVAQAYATPAPNAPFLMCENLLWSRDGQRFAVVFVLTQGDRTLLGVAVVRAQDGAVERVVAAPQIASGYMVWDLNAGTAATYDTQYSTSAGITRIIAPALTWSATGELQPSGTFPPPGTNEPIGNPNGDASFSIWQPGSVVRSMPSGSGRQGQAGAYVFNTQLVAWSPDARYVAAFFVAGGRLQPSHTPAPDGATLAQSHGADLPLLPLRDAGLDQALHHVLTRMDLANASSQSTAWIAYRSDGKAIALLDDQQDFAVYSAGSGTALYPFRYLNLLPNTHNGNAWALRWSPDGTALLLPDGSLLHVGRLGG